MFKLIGLAGVIVALAVAAEADAAGQRDQCYQDGTSVIVLDCDKPERDRPARPEVERPDPPKPDPEPEPECPRDGS